MNLFLKILKQQLQILAFQFSKIRTAQGRIKGEEFYNGCAPPPVEKYQIWLPRWEKRLKGVYSNESRGGGYVRSGTKKMFNCKLKTFDFLDTLKVQIQSSYFTSTTLSLLQRKLAETNSKLILLCSSLFSFRF